MDARVSWVLRKDGTLAARPRRGQHLERGVTLIEVMIVVVILGLIASGVAVAVFPKFKEAQIKTTKTSAMELRRATEMWRGMHASDQCPTLEMLRADKAFDSRDFVDAARKLNVTVHVTKNDKKRRSTLDRRTTRHPGYAISLSRRWLVEKGFGWLKQTGPIRQVKLRGLHKVDWLFVFSCAAHNLSRLPRLIAQRHAATFGESCA